MSKEIETPKKWDLCVIHLKHLWNTNIFHQDRLPIIGELDPSSSVPSLQSLLPNLKLLHLVFVIQYKIPIVYFRVSQPLWTCLVWLSFQWRGIRRKGAWIAHWQQVKVKKKKKKGLWPPLCIWWQPSFPNPPNTGLPFTPPSTLRFFSCFSSPQTVCLKEMST